MGGLVRRRHRRHHPCHWRISVDARTGRRNHGAARVVAANGIEVLARSVRLATAGDYRTALGIDICGVPPNPGSTTVQHRARSVEAARLGRTMTRRLRRSPTARSRTDPVPRSFRPAGSTPARVCKTGSVGQPLVRDAAVRFNVRHAAPPTGLMQHTGGSQRTGEEVPRPARSNRDRPTHAPVPRQHSEAVHRVRYRAYCVKHDQQQTGSRRYKLFRCSTPPARNARTGMPPAKTQQSGSVSMHVPLMQRAAADHTGSP